MSGAEQRPPLTALEWLRVTHAGTLSARRIEQAVAEAHEQGRRDMLANATARSGARIVEAWRDHPVRSRIGQGELADLERLIDEAVLAARLEGFTSTMRLVERAVRLAPWGVDDPLAIRDDLLRALAPDAPVPPGVAS